MRNAAGQVIVYRQGVLRGRLQLRKTNLINRTLEDLYPLPATPIIKATLPGEPDSIVASSVDGDITVVDASLSTIDYFFDNTKMAQVTIGENVSLDVFVEDTDGNIEAFEALEVFEVRDVKNPLP